MEACVWTNKCDSDDPCDEDEPYSYCSHNDQCIGICNHNSYMNDKFADGQFAEEDSDCRSNWRLSGRCTHRCSSSSRCCESERWQYCMNDYECYSRCSSHRCYDSKIADGGASTEDKDCASGFKFKGFCKRKCTKTSPCTSSTPHHYCNDNIKDCIGGGCKKNTCN